MFQERGVGSEAQWGDITGTVHVDLSWPGHEGGATSGGLLVGKVNSRSQNKKFRMFLGKYGWVEIRGD